MERQNFDDRDKRLEAFTGTYRAAWEASGKPSRWTTAELFVDVLGNNESQQNVDLHPLMVFFRAALMNAGIPLNWYTREGLDALFPPPNRRVVFIRTWPFFRQ